MNQTELVKLLETFTFRGLVLFKLDAKTATYKFESYDHKKLEKALGKPAVAAEAKVAVFIIADIGKIGVCPSNSMVRFVASPSSASAPQADSSHLGEHDTSAELELQYARAQGSARHRIAFVKTLWTHFNETKFEGRMKMPKIEVSHKPSFKTKHTTARGIHMGGRNYGPGIIWIADFLFNARRPFFYEILLHEMCLTGDSLISTNLGDIRIDALANSGATHAQSRHGLTPISRVWESSSKPTLELTTAAGYSLRLTDDHPVLVRRWYGCRWIPAGQLKPGDRLLRRSA